MRFLTTLTLIGIILTSSCKKEDPTTTPPNSITFSETNSLLEEGLKRKKYTVNLVTPVKEAIPIRLRLQGSATLGVDYSTEPSLSSGSFIVNFAPNSSSVEFSISINLDNESESTETIVISVDPVPNGFEASQGLTVSISNNTLKNGLVGEYLFDASANDTRPNANHGTIFNAISATDHTSTGPHALFFDGDNNYVSIPSANQLNFPNGSNFSISLWASPSSAQSQPTNQIFDIVRKWIGNAEGYPFSISYTNSLSPVPDRFFVARYDGAACNNAPTLSSNIVMGDRYYHVVLVKNGNLLKLFVDKILVSETSDTTNGGGCSETNTSHVTVGCRGQLVRFYKGLVDDLRFYDRALTQEEINKLFAI